MARLVTPRQWRVRFGRQRLLLAGLLWLAVTLAILLVTWLAGRWLAASTQLQPIAQNVVAPAFSQQSGDVWLLRGDSPPAIPTLAAASLAAVAGDSATPFLPSAAPQADALADDVAPQVASVLLDVPRSRQDRNLNCELISATDLATFYGWDFTWRQLFEFVGVDPAGDPNVGFVGRSMNDPVGGLYPAGYGVYADPVARGLRSLGVPARAHAGVDRAWLQAQLLAGHPVVIWTTYGMQRQPLIEWQTGRGDTVRGVRYEHTFVVAGFDESGVWVNDPWDATQRHYPWPAVEASWALLGNMAVTIDFPQ